MVFTEDVAKEIEDVKSRYPVPGSALLPLLHIAQREFGWLSPEALEAVAGELHMPKALVRGVASFHTMFRTRPMGRHIIRLCTNVTCMLLGSEGLLDVIRERFGLEPGGTTADGRFSLVSMECIGACNTAPAMLVNTDLHTGLNQDNIAGILEGYK